MIFYARKSFRKLGAHFTFVIVTDPDDIDGQIYRNFLDTGTVSKAEAAQPKKARSCAPTSPLPAHLSSAATERPTGGSATTCRNTISSRAWTMARRSRSFIRSGCPRC